jgi:hypothetical protein
MSAFRFVLLAAALALPLGLARAQEAGNAPLPAIRQLLREVQEHQKQLEKVRETYTYSSAQTVEDLDAGGRVTKTETEEHEDFYVNGHPIQRTVKKNGQALSEQEEQKETERVTKLVEKAEKTPPEEALEGPSITVSRVLEIMDAHNPRRESYRGRATIVFDIVGRKDAKTHGLAEDMSKKLAGTIWVDEADRQVARMEVTFNDNFRLMGGLVASIEKGSSFHFDQAIVSHPNDKDPSLGAPDVNGEIWLPTGGEGTMEARVLLVKNYRRRFKERDYDFKRFRVETQQGKDAKAVPEQKP